MARRMAGFRIGWRNRIDALWYARAEKQRRLGLGLGDPPAASRLTVNNSISSTASEVGTGSFNEAGSEAKPASLAEIEVGDGADRVGTLLVRMGQLDGVGGVGILSLAPKAVATLMLEESSATLEEMDMETNSTKVQTSVVDDVLVLSFLVSRARVYGAPMTAEATCYIGAALFGQAGFRSCCSIVIDSHLVLPRTAQGGLDRQQRVFHDLVDANPAALPCRTRE